METLISYAKHSYPVQTKLLQDELRELQEYEVKVEQEDPTKAQLDALERSLNTFIPVVNASIDEISSLIRGDLTTNITKTIRNLETKIENSIKQLNTSHPAKVTILKAQLVQLKALATEINSDVEIHQFLDDVEALKKRINNIDIIYEDIVKVISGPTETPI